MEQREINNFAILIICLVCLVFGFAGVSVLVASAYFDTVKYSGLLNLISSLGSFLGGAAGTIAAIAAYVGVDAWKKQIKHGKHISLIWSCMESIRNFQRRKARWYIYAYAYGTSQTSSVEEMNIEKKLLDSALEELSSLFCALDKIVVKNQWQWANYRDSLAIDISKLVGMFQEYQAEPYSEQILCQELLEINNRIQKSVEFIEAELDILESHYQ